MTTWLKLLKDSIALITALVALFTAVAGLITSWANREQLRLLQSCAGEVALTIDRPRNGERTSGDVDVQGRSTAHDVCRFVFLGIRDVSTGGLPW